MLCAQAQSERDAARSRRTQSQQAAYVADTLSVAGAGRLGAALLRP
mgnify:CR=1 FL=1